MPSRASTLRAPGLCGSVLRDRTATREADGTLQAGFSVFESSAPSILGVQTSVA